MKFNRQIFQLILVLFVLFSGKTSAQNIDSIFVNMPAKINPLLNKQSKLKLLDNYKKNLTDSVQNSFLGKSIVMRYDSANHTIKVQNSAKSYMEVFVMKNGAGIPFFGVISTMGDSLKNSEIAFYNADWSYINITFKKPEAADWLILDKLTQDEFTPGWAASQIVVSFVTLEYIPEKKQIKAENNSIRYITEEVRSIIDTHLNHTPVFFAFDGVEWIKK